MYQVYALLFWMILINIAIIFKNAKMLLILFIIFIADTILCSCYDAYGLKGILIGYVPSIIIEILTSK